MWIMVKSDRAINLDHVREAYWKDGELLLYFNDSAVRRFGDDMNGRQIWQEIQNYATLAWAMPTAIGGEHGQE